MKWEEIERDEGSHSLVRCKLPVGWLVLETILEFKRKGSAYSMVVTSSNLCFVPDPNHDWKLEK